MINNVRYNAHYHVVLSVLTDIIPFCV